MKSYIKPMNYIEFAAYLLTLKDGDVIEFGCDAGGGWPEETPEVHDVECWYFARIISIPEYSSRFILIDYCGGEEAFAIPLNCYQNHCDEDDRNIVPEFVKRFFCNHCLNLGSIDDYVFVEIKEE